MSPTTPEDKPQPQDKPPVQPGQPVPPPPAEQAVESTDEKEKKASNLNVKKRVDTARHILARYQVPIITAVVGVLLTITALRMIHYANPVADDNRVQENLSKFKAIHIDQKTVQQIKDLNNAQAPSSTDINNNRTNPFAE